MASIVGAFVMPHVPLILCEPTAPQPEQVARIHAAFDRIVNRLRELAVDTVITVGADHYGLFGPHCIPQCLLAIGDVEGPAEPWLGVERRVIATNQPLAQHILRHGHENGIDWAFAKSMVVDHATVVPHHFCIRPLLQVKTIPVYLNEAVAPFIPSRRALEVGAGIHRAVQAWNGAEKVAIFGTGGISHWVGMAKMGQVNEEFDRRVMKMAEAGDLEALLELSDEEILDTAGNGAMEIKSWICAMGALPRARAEVIAYEPVAQWCTGFGFAELKAAA